MRREEGVLWRCRGSERCDVVFGCIQGPSPQCCAGASDVCVIFKAGVNFFFFFGATCVVPLFDLITPPPPPPVLSHQQLHVLFHVISNSCSLVILCEVQGSKIPAVSRGVWGHTHTHDCPSTYACVFMRYERSKSFWCVCVSAWICPYSGVKQPLRGYLCRNTQGRKDFIRCKCCVGCLAEIVQNGATMVGTLSLYCSRLLAQVVTFIRKNATCVNAVISVSKCECVPLSW